MAHLLTEFAGTPLWHSLPFEKVGFGTEMIWFSKKSPNRVLSVFEFQNSNVSNCCGIQICIHCIQQKSFHQKDRSILIASLLAESLF